MELKTQLFRLHYQLYSESALMIYVIISLTAMAYGMMRIVREVNDYERSCMTSSTLVTWIALALLLLDLANLTLSPPSPWYSSLNPDSELVSNPTL